MPRHRAAVHGRDGTQELLVISRFARLGASIARRNIFGEAPVAKGPVAKGKVSTRRRPAEDPSPAAHPGAGVPCYRVFVRDLVVPCLVGVHPHERELAQRVRVSVDLTVEDNCASAGDDIANVVSYEDIVTGVKAVTQRGRTGLVETLAEEIAGLCLQDPRVASARVRVEKLDVFAEAASVGVEIERRRSARAVSGEKVVTFGSKSTAEP